MGRITVLVAVAGILIKVAVAEGRLDSHLFFVCLSLIKYRPCSQVFVNFPWWPRKIKTKQKIQLRDTCSFRPCLSGGLEEEWRRKGHLADPILISLRDSGRGNSGVSTIWAGDQMTYVSRSGGDNTKHSGLEEDWRIGGAQEEDWRIGGLEDWRIGGLEENWKRLGGGLEEVWRRIGRGLEEDWKRFGG